MTSLVIKPSPNFVSVDENKEFELVIRYHDLGGTDYVHVAYLSESLARSVVDSSNTTWLYGDPLLDKNRKSKSVCSQCGK
tara:strand:+ start:108 stop:347 length:240 start_codon:yes stop_codon:yes gene_type:complete